jgi:hypothetical protein
VTLVLQILVATALVAVFMVLRINADERVLQHRRRCSHAGAADGGHCHGGCGSRREAGGADDG